MNATLPLAETAAETAAETDDALVALHDRWSRQLLTRIDAALELGTDSPSTSVGVAWRSALRDQPEVYARLEAEAANPVLRASRRSLHAWAAVAAGLATFDDPLSVRALAGERLLAAVAAEPLDVHRSSRLSRLIRRLWDGAPTPDPYPWAA